MELMAKQSGRKHRITNGFLAGIAIVISYIWDVLYIAVNGVNLRNSDASAEMILANLLEGPEIITDKWNYSTELRFLNTQLVYRVALHLFPDDWQAARVLSEALFLLIILLASFVLIYGAGLGSRYLWWSCALLLPFGQWYGWNVIFNSYYVPHIALSMISLGLFLLLLRRKRAEADGAEKHRISDVILLLLLLLVAFLACLGGMRQLMVCYAPMFLTTIVIGIHDWRRGRTEKKTEDRRAFGLSFLVAVAGGIGYLVNTHVLSKYYSFSSFNEQHLYSFDLNTLLTDLGEFFESFGWQEDVSITTPRGIADLLSIVIVCAIFYGGYRLVRHETELSAEKRFLNGFFWIFFLFQLLIFVVTENYNASYWVPLLPFAVLVLFLWIFEDVKRVKARRLCQAVTTFWMFACAFLTMLHPYISWVPNDLAIQPVAEWLEEQGYTQGYATIWNGDIVTELTDGDIEMWVIYDFTDVNNINGWLQAVEHQTQKPDGKVFFLLTSEENQNSGVLSEMTDHIVYQTDSYIVYDFDSLDEYEAEYQALTGEQ